MSKTDQPEEPQTFEVKFTPEALGDLAELFPNLPPGDEIILQMRFDPCYHCGKDITEGEIAAMDPDYINGDGILIGRQICNRCLQKGK